MLGRLSQPLEDLVQLEAEWAIQIKREIDEAFAFAERSSFQIHQNRLRRVLWITIHGTHLCSGDQ